MPKVRFSKYEGLANDFILVDRADGWVTARAAARLCDRRRGVGADGILTLLPSRTDAAAIRMHVFNADGSVAEMCGNGLRCVVRYAVGRSAAIGAKLTVDTDGGLRAGTLVEDGRVRVSMGHAALLDADVEAVAADARFSGMAISMGNPHLVISSFAPDTDLMTLARKYGPELERHPRFPDRVNVGFAAVEGRHVRLVVFERGSGITQACGTGAAAAAVAARHQHGRVEGPVTVHLPGGPLDILVEDGDDPALPGQVIATGPAHHVFDGEVEVAEDELQMTQRV